MSVVSAVAGSFLMIGVASAAMINGGISFNGWDWAPILDGNDNIIGINYEPNEGISGSGSGDFANLGTNTMTNRDITFDPFFAMEPLWKIVSQIGEFSFNLEKVTVLVDHLNFIGLEGTGTLYSTNFDPTPGTWILTANSIIGEEKNAITSSWSSSTGAAAPVPEPATMLLFGTGLAGLAGMARKRNKKLNS